MPTTADLTLEMELPENLYIIVVNYREYGATLPFMIRLSFMIRLAPEGFGLPVFTSREKRWRRSRYWSCMMSYG